MGEKKVERKGVEDEGGEFKEAVAQVLRRQSSPSVTG